MFAAVILHLKHRALKRAQQFASTQLTSNAEAWMNGLPWLCNSETHLYYYVSVLLARLVPACI